MIRFDICSSKSDSEPILNHLRTLSFNITCDDAQKERLCSAIRLIASRVPKGRKRDVYLEKYYDWDVEKVQFMSQILQTVENE